MKKNVRIIASTLLLALIPLSIYVGLCFVFALAGFVYKVPDFSRKLLATFFVMETPVDDTAISVFLMGYSFLMAYLFISVNNLRLTLKGIAKKGAFENNNAQKLFAAGRGLIRFSWIKYLVFWFFGWFAFFDAGVVLYQFLPFLAVFVLGKFVLVVADMTKRGEMLLEETELTI